MLNWILQQIGITTKTHFAKGLNIIFSEDKPNFNKSAFLTQGVFIRLKDNQWLMGWGEFHWSQEASSTEPSFFVSDFYLEKEKKWLSTEYYIIISDLLELKKLFKKEAVKTVEFLNTQFDGYEKQFQNIFLDFKNKNLKKAVPVSFESSCDQLSTQHIENIIYEFIGKPSYFYPYGFWQEGKGVIGLSPEILAQIIICDESYELHTMALAGTAPIDNPKGSLLESQKDMNEHNYVIKEIDRVLSQFGEVELGQTEEVNLQKLKHLRTDISLLGSLSGVEPVKFLNTIIETLHPTPALGGYPKKEATKWLDENRVEQRSFFGAPFGVYYKSEFFALVAIRNILWDKKSSYIFSGGGVVKESLIEDEWSEILLKRKATKTHLGICNEVN
ncbi:MAG: hypothetical protein HOO06_06275 [Bdellovibrionaceae bacterium]|nr:hypothetical protein [Pseudobdellovibrionaceae bacterium]